MNRFLFFIFLTAGLSACSSSTTSSPSSGQLAQSDSWGTYAETPLAGRVLGHDWAAVTAVIRPFGSDPQLASLTVYAESPADACKNPIVSKPTVSIVLPKNYQLGEYAYDLMSGQDGNPLVFSQGSNNVLAERTKYRINALTDTGFEVSVYALGTDESGQTSEINGKIQVLDCAKITNLADWDELKNWYTLTHFDGKAVKEKTAIIEADNGRIFYSRQQGRYLKSLEIPLYYFVSDNSSGEYSFGPIDGLGSTSITEANGTKTFVYSYHGPVVYEGTDIELNLKITVIKNAQTINVTYSIEIPKYVKPASHSFTLRK